MVKMMDGLAAPPLLASQIKPQPGRLLVRRYKKTEKTSGGIIRPESSREISQMGRVEAVAGDVQDVQVGQWVIFSGYAAPMVATNDVSDDLVLIKVWDVLGIAEVDGVTPNGQKETP